MTTQRYIFNTAEAGEYQRLLDQAYVWDRLTFRRLGEIGVGKGWRCLEIGAGSGTVVRWLADRVGPTGHVVATDLETKWLRAIEVPNVEVLEHEINTGSLGDSVYDLINLRLVLVHQPDKQAVLDKLVKALVPGGSLLIEEYDMRTLPICSPPDDTWHAAGGAPVEFLEKSGLDPHLGIRLPGMFETAGLVDVDAEAVGFPRRIPTNCAWQTQFVALREPLIATGLVTAEQIDEVIADSTTRTAGSSCTGRRWCR